MCKMKDLNYPLHPLLPTPLDDTCPYTLRHKSDQLYFYKNVTTCRTKRTEDFFTFKYFEKIRCIIWCGVKNFYLMFTEIDMGNFIKFSLYYNSLIH